VERLDRERYLHRLVPLLLVEKPTEVRLGVEQAYPGFGWHLINEVPVQAIGEPRLRGS
jgi:hypothetical protein